MNSDDKICSVIISGNSHEKLNLLKSNILEISNLDTQFPMNDEIHNIGLYVKSISLVDSKHSEEKFFSINFLVNDFYNNSWFDAVNNFYHNVIQKYINNYNYAVNSIFLVFKSTDIAY